MQKSSARKRNYRQNTWNLREARATLAQQMAATARGERLRQLRAERGLSQEEVAQVLGVTAKTYGDWERGGGIHATNARKVARYFKVKPADIVTPDFEPASLNGDGASQEQLDRIERKLDEILERLDDPATQDEPAVLPSEPLPPARERPPAERPRRAGRSR
jgi:transcriptional regulator with XRE-family HTH domain